MSASPLDPSLAPEERAAEQALAGFDGEVVVTYGDVPLLKAADIEPVFADAHEGVTVIGFEARDPGAIARHKDPVAGHFVRTCPVLHGVRVD